MIRKKSEKKFIKNIRTPVFFIMPFFIFLNLSIHVFGEEKDIIPPEIKVEITDADKEFTSGVRKAYVTVTDNRMKGEIKKEYVFKEGKDSFYIKIKDAAGNESSFKSDVYIQDYTAPTVCIDGISDEETVNGELKIIISAKDEWLDTDKSYVKITGRNSHKIFGYCFEGGENSISISDKDFFADDYYALKIYLIDKAGNENVKHISFTINRNGSAFEVDGKNKEKIGLIAEEIKGFCITERNVSKVDCENARILFSFNARAIDLKTGEDYRVEEKQDAQGFVYTYIFYDELFIKDGVYTISVSTKDEAGNVNDTRFDKNSDEIRFAVKRGLNP